MVESEKELGKVGFDLQTGHFWGEVLHLCGRETFHAETVDELRQLLRESVPGQQLEESIAGAPADEAYFESLVIHVEPLLFYRLSQQAMLHGKSLNHYIVGILKEVVEQAQTVEPLP
jgi:predicted HicB family RNase H-like nuclease